MMEKVPVYILSGGKSSRFGRDKARAMHAGMPLLLHAVRSFHPIAESVSVIADKPGKYDDLGVRTIADITKGLGPIGGLQTAIADRGKDGWLLLASCDLIGIRNEWLHILLAEISAGSGMQAVAFRNKIWEPMPALYHTSIKTVVDQIIARQKSAIWHVLGAIDSVGLPYPADWEKAVNINRPIDLACFKKNCAAAATTRR
jgi:molybdopterin-guanine dinucleotide biosynthesis protein A